MAWQKQSQLGIMRLQIRLLGLAQGARPPSNIQEVGMEAGQNTNWVCFFFFFFFWSF